MAYEKITGDPSIRFYYVTDDVFNAVSEATSFVAASFAPKQDGTIDFDRIHISTDEKTYMKKFLKEAMLEVFSTCFKLIYSDSITHDASLTLVGGSTVTASHVKVQDNAKYRTINLDLIDQKINNALLSFILSEWYFLKGLADQSKLYEAKFKEYVTEISKLTLILRQPA